MGQLKISKIWIKKKRNTTTWSGFIWESIMIQFFKLRVGQVKMVSFFKNVTMEEWTKCIWSTVQ